MEMDYKEVSEAVNELDNDFEVLRERARGRYELYSMRRDPYVPEDIAREGKFRINSPLVMNSAREIRADLMMNPTEFMVVPLARESGAISRPMERKAENLERALAIIWGRLNEGRAIDREIIWHQLVSPFAVMTLQFNEYLVPDQPEWMSDKQYVEFITSHEREWMPWSVNVPDPLTCSWMERGGKPVMFAQKYKTTVYDLEHQFSKNVASTAPNKNLRFIDQRFRWVGDDYDDTYATKLAFKQIDVLYLDTGDYIYQAAMNPDGNGSGVSLACVPNPTGRVSSYIVPGNITPARRPEDKYEPFLLPLMQNVMQTNDIRSTRATAARNLAGPHTYIPIDPETQRLYITRGEKLPTAHRWKKNETPYLLGDVATFPSELSTDWDKLEQGIQQEQQRLLPSPFVHVLDPAVLKAATATSILHAAESGLRTYGPLMTGYDAAIRDLMANGVVNSILRYYDEMEIYNFASGEEMARGRSIQQGSLYRLDQKAVDFPHRLMVKTRGMSQAQASAQYELVERQWVLPDGSKGPASFDDLLDAGNYTDKPAQKIKLVVEGFLQVVMPYLQDMAVNVVRESVSLQSGIVLPIGMGAPGGAPGAPGDSSKSQPSGLPNAAQRMDSPMITGPSGGTDSTPISGPIV